MLQLEQPLYSTYFLMIHVPKNLLVEEASKLGAARTRNRDPNKHIIFIVVRDLNCSKWLLPSVTPSEFWKCQISSTWILYPAPWNTYNFLSTGNVDMLKENTCFCFEHAQEIKRLWCMQVRPHDLLLEWQIFWCGFSAIAEDTSLTFLLACMHVYSPAQYTHPHTSSHFLGGLVISLYIVASYKLNGWSVDICIFNYWGRGNCTASNPSYRDTVVHACALFIWKNLQFIQATSVVDPAGYESHLWNL